METNEKEQKILKWLNELSPELNFLESAIKAFKELVRYCYQHEDTISEEDIKEWLTKSKQFERYLAGHISEYAQKWYLLYEYYNELLSQSYSESEEKPMNHLTITNDMLLNMENSPKYGELFKIVYSDYGQKKWVKSSNKINSWTAEKLTKAEAKLCLLFMSLGGTITYNGIQYKVITNNEAWLQFMNEFHFDSSVLDDEIKNNLLKLLSHNN